jgi:hypothetical protein
MISLLFDLLGEFHKKIRQVRVPITPLMRQRVRFVQEDGVPALNIVLLAPLMRQRVRFVQEDGIPALIGTLR